MKSVLLLLACTLATLHLQSNVALTQAAQLRRVWMQDHCQNGICTGIEIGRDDYVILSQSPIEKQIMLHFVNSSIAKIPHLMFDTFPDLQVLRMQNCSVETFEKPQFEGASNLMNLFLGHNLLLEIPKNIFLGADNLNSLMLHHNQLRVLHNGSFHALKELKELSLEANQLVELPAGVFAPLRKLMDLNLASNKLETVPRGIFDKNLNLRRLSLAHNRFKTFEMELLKFHPIFYTLDLSGNSLQELELNFTQLSKLEVYDCDLRTLTIFGFVKELNLRNNSFRNMPSIQQAGNVTSLDLSENPLGSLHENPLRRFTGLQRLNLSATHAHNIEETLFRKQTQLNLLDISANTLFSLKLTVFDNLKSLQFFYFQQNNWNCDFLQMLMTSFVKRREISFMEDTVAPELVDDYVDGIACWYETNKASKKCDGEMNDAAMELAIVRNDIKEFTEVVEKKFIKVYQLLEEMKMRL